MSENPFFDYQKKMVDMWTDSFNKIPGLDAYMDAFKKLMPDENMFTNMWPYKIPGMEVYSKVFDLWKGMSNPMKFTQDFQEKYMDLMQDMFKYLLPEGSAKFFEKPMELVDSCVDFYLKTISPWMTVDESIMKRIASGDMTGYADFFRDFNKKYEDTFDKFFNMMGMGVNREANEDMMKAINSYYKLMFSAGELVSVVMNTFAQSMNELVEKFQKDLTEGKPLSTFRDFYDLWYSVTEGELVKLLETDEFSRVFNEYSDKYGQYMIAMNREYERMLSSLPIPTNKDMKSLYKTVYELRKDVRDLKREVSSMKDGKKEATGNE